MSDLSAQLAAKIEMLWRSSKAVVFERLSVLHLSSRRLAASPADAEACRSGREAAHKLAGVLGVFGLPQGSELASRIEVILGRENPIAPEELQVLDKLVHSLDAVISSKDSQGPIS
jgi:HPt (histidine-containing phosphotransfer) domain-containing protein